MFNWFFNLFTKKASTEAKPTQSTTPIQKEADSENSGLSIMPEGFAENKEELYKIVSRKARSARNKAMQAGNIIPLDALVTEEVHNSQNSKTPYRALPKDAVRKLRAIYNMSINKGDLIFAVEQKVRESVFTKNDSGNEEVNPLKVPLLSAAKDAKLPKDILIDLITFLVASVLSKFDITYRRNDASDFMYKNTLDKLYKYSIQWLGDDQLREDPANKGLFYSPLSEVQCNKLKELFPQYNSYTPYQLSLLYIWSTQDATNRTLENKEKINRIFKTPVPNFLKHLKAAKDVLDKNISDTLYTEVADTICGAVINQMKKYTSNRDLFDLMEMVKNSSTVDVTDKDGEQLNPEEVIADPNQSDPLELLIAEEEKQRADAKKQSKRMMANLTNLTGKIRSDVLEYNKKTKPENQIKDPSLSAFYNYLLRLADVYEGGTYTPRAFTDFYTFFKYIKDKGIDVYDVPALQQQMNDAFSKVQIFNPFYMKNKKDKNVVKDGQKVPLKKVIDELEGMKVALQLVGIIKRDSTQPNTSPYFYTQLGYLKSILTERNPDKERITSEYDRLTNMLASHMRLRDHLKDIVFYSDKENVTDKVNELTALQAKDPSQVDATVLSELSNCLNDEIRLIKLYDAFSQSYYVLASSENPKFSEFAHKLEPIMKSLSVPAQNYVDLSIIRSLLVNHRTSTLSADQDKQAGEELLQKLNALATNTKDTSIATLATTLQTAMHTSATSGAPVLTTTMCDTLLTGLSDYVSASISPAIAKETPAIIQSIDKLDKEVDIVLNNERLQYDTVIEKSVDQFSIATQDDLLSNFIKMITVKYSGEDLDQEEFSKHLGYMEKEMKKYFSNLRDNVVGTISAGMREAKKIVLDSLAQNTKKIRYEITNLPDITNEGRRSLMHAATAYYTDVALNTVHTYASKYLDTLLYRVDDRNMRKRDKLFGQIHNLDNHTVMNEIRTQANLMQQLDAVSFATWLLNKTGKKGMPIMQELRDVFIETFKTEIVQAGGDFDSTANKMFFDLLNNPSKFLLAASDEATAIKSMNPITQFAVKLTDKYSNWQSVKDEYTKDTGFIPYSVSNAKLDDVAALANYFGYIAVEGMIDPVVGEQYDVQEGLQELAAVCDSITNVRSKLDKNKALSERDRTVIYNEMRDLGERLRAAVSKLKVQLQFLENRSNNDPVSQETYENAINNIRTSINGATRLVKTLLEDDNAQYMFSTIAYKEAEKHFNTYDKYLQNGLTTAHKQIADMYNACSASIKDCQEDLKWLSYYITQLKSKLPNKNTRSFDKDIERKDAQSFFERNKALLYSTTQAQDVVKSELGHFVSDVLEDKFTQFNLDKLNEADRERALAAYKSYRASLFNNDQDACAAFIKKIQNIKKEYDLSTSNDSELSPDRARKSLYKEVVDQLGIADKCIVKNTTPGGRVDVNKFENEFMAALYSLLGVVNKFNEQDVYKKLDKWFPDLRFSNNRVKEELAHTLVHSFDSYKKREHRNETEVSPLEEDIKFVESMKQLVGFIAKSSSQAMQTVWDGDEKQQFVTAEMLKDSIGQQKELDVARNAFYKVVSYVNTFQKGLPKLQEVVDNAKILEGDMQLSLRDNLHVDNLQHEYVLYRDNVLRMNKLWGNAVNYLVSLPQQVVNKQEFDKIKYELKRFNTRDFNDICEENNVNLRVPGDTAPKYIVNEDDKKQFVDKLDTELGDGIAADDGHIVDNIPHIMTLFPNTIVCKFNGRYYKVRKRRGAGEDKYARTTDIVYPQEPIIENPQVFSKTDNVDGQVKDTYFVTDGDQKHWYPMLTPTNVGRELDGRPDGDLKDLGTMHEFLEKYNDRSSLPLNIKDDQVDRYQKEQDKLNSIVTGAIGSGHSKFIREILSPYLTPTEIEARIASGYDDRIFQFDAGDNFSELPRATQLRIEEQRAISLYSSLTDNNGKKMYNDAEVRKLVNKHMQELRVSLASKDKAIEQLKRSGVPDDKIDSILEGRTKINYFVNGIIAATDSEALSKHEVLTNLRVQLLQRLLEIADKHGIDYVSVLLPVVSARKATAIDTMLEDIKYLLEQKAKEEAEQNNTGYDGIKLGDVEKLISGVWESIRNKERAGSAPAAYQAPKKEELDELVTNMGGSNAPAEAPAAPAEAPAEPSAPATVPEEPATKEKPAEEEKPGTDPESTNTAYIHFSGIKKEAAFFNFVQHDAPFMKFAATDGLDQFTSDQDLQKAIEQPFGDAMSSSEQQIADQRAISPDNVSNQGSTSTGQDAYANKSFSSRQLVKAFQAAYEKDPGTFDDLLRLVRQSGSTGIFTADILSLLPKVNWVAEAALREYNKTANPQIHRNSFQRGLEKANEEQLSKSDMFNNICKSILQGKPA